MEKNIAGLMTIELDSRESAERNAKIMKNCPRIAASGYSSNCAFNLFVIPEDKRWWIEYPVEHPEVMGAKSVKLSLIDHLTYPEKFELRIPDEKLEIAPCGSNCMDCPSRERFNCKGCPATIYYQQE